MSFSHSSSDQALVQYSQHVADVVDSAVDVSLQGSVSKEKDLLALYFSVMSYVGSYLTNYPTRVDSLQFSPETAAVKEAYQYIVNELFNKTQWRDELNLQEKMSELLLDLKMKLLARVALEAEGGYLASGILNALNPENQIDPRHLELAWEILRDGSINKKLSAGLSEALATVILKALSEKKQLTGEQFRLVQEILRAKNGNERFMAALSDYLALAVVDTLNKKNKMDSEHFELFNKVLKDGTSNAYLVAALGSFELSLPVLGKQPVDRYKVYYEDNEQYAARIESLVINELKKNTIPEPAVGQELEQKRRREGVERLALLAKNKKPLPPKADKEEEEKELIKTADKKPVQEPIQVNYQAIIERDKRAQAAQERIAKLRAQEKEAAVQANQKKVKFVEEPEVFEYVPLPSFEPATQAPKTAWWKYALAITGFLLGAAALATGVGALLTVTALGISLASIGVAAAVSAITAGGVTVLGCSAYLGSAAYKDHQARKKQQALSECDKRAEVPQNGLRAESGSRVASSAVPLRSALKRQAQSQVSSPVSITSVSLFSGEKPDPAVVAKPAPSRKCCFT